MSCLFTVTIIRSHLMIIMMIYDMAGELGLPGAGPVKPVVVAEDETLATKQCVLLMGRILVWESDRPF